jgi:type I restriction enzyme, S subunit
VSFLKYPSYKDSTIKCFQHIPQHWEVARIDRLFEQRNEESLPDDKLVSAFITGEVTLRENKSENIIKSSGMEIGYKRIRIGDLAISGMTAHLGGLGISDSDGKCSPVYLVLKPMVEIDGL